jgi:pimeloyl-ACP methyl ester carboxylesterase
VNPAIPLDGWQRMRQALRERALAAEVALGKLELSIMQAAISRYTGTKIKTHGDGPDQITYVARAGHGLPLVGIHGFGGDKETWLLMAAQLPHSQPVYFLDLPGHGESATPTSPTGIRRHAEAVLRMMDAEGIANAVMCGNSMGGGVSLRLAHSWPDRVAGFVLLDSIGNDIHQNAVAIDWMNGDNPLIPGINDVEAFMKTISERPLPVPKAVIRYVTTKRALAADKLRILYRDFISQNGEQGVPSDLSNINKPALIIHGEQDRVIDKRVAQSLAQQIKGAELQIMRGVGHAPQLEAPKATAKLVAKFLQQMNTSAM